MQSTAKGRMSFSSTGTQETHDSFQDHLSIRESIADRHPSLAVLSRLGSESTYFSDIAKMPGLVTSSYEDRKKSNWSYSVSSRVSDIPLAKRYDDSIEVIHMNVLSPNSESYSRDNSGLLDNCQMKPGYEVNQSRENKKFLWVKGHLQMFVAKLQDLARDIDGNELSLPDAREAVENCYIDELDDSSTDPKAFLYSALKQTKQNIQGIQVEMDGRSRINALTDVVSIMLKIFTLMNNSNYLEDERAAEEIESLARKSKRKNAIVGYKKKKKNKKGNKYLPQVAVGVEGAPNGRLNISGRGLESIQVLAKVLLYFKFFIFFALEWELLKLKEREGFFTKKEANCFNFYKNEEYIPAIYKVRVERNKL